MPKTPQQATTQQLKADIDSGKTDDKIDEGYDLGLSALGTDDEAAGTRPTPQEVATAERLERAAPAQPVEQGARNPARDFPAVWIIVAAFVAVLIALGAAIL